MFGAVQDDACTDTRVYVTNSVDGIRGETEVGHDAEEMRVADGVEGGGEINVEAINVAVVRSGVLEGVDKALEVSGGALLLTETLLALAKDGVILGV